MVNCRAVVCEGGGVRAEKGEGGDEGATQLIMFSNAKLRFTCDYRRSNLLSIMCDFP